MITDNRGEIHLLGETAAVLFIGQDIDGQSQPTSGQYGHETLLSERADETIDRHGREMTDDCTAFQTQSTMRRQQGVAGDLRTHLAIAQDKVGQDGEHHFAPRTLETPDGDPTQADTDIMGVACQAPTALTSCLVCELKAKGQDKSHHQFNKGLAVAKQLNVGRFVSKIDSDGPVFAGPFGCVLHVSPPHSMALQVSDI